MRIFTTKHVGDEVGIRNARWGDIKTEASKYSEAVITVENASGVGPITYAQIKWIKGILLTQLSSITGESMSYWEDILKLKVMPDKFALVTTKTENAEITHLPSITILTKAEAGEFIVGSVAHLRDESVYGQTFNWVLLPDPELRS
jgi:hypothetical protein